jgi:uncharacterized protein YecE (DUF72 family)
MKSETDDDAPIKIPVAVGTMGWSYADWNGVFYPENAESKEWLPLYARAFDAVEIDSTFYGTPRKSTVLNWYRSVPDNFLFCSKVPRIITHDMGLRDADNSIAEFARTMAALRQKRGPMLFQMPPSFTRDQLDALAALAPKLNSLADPTARFAIEFRHPSLLTADVFALLKEHHIALAATDYPGMPKRFAPTADFAYVRLIGRHGAFKTHRETVENHGETIRRWASAVRRHQDKFRGAFILCNNDYEGFAPDTCWKVQSALGLPVRRPAVEMQGQLF